RRSMSLPHCYHTSVCLRVLLSFPTRRSSDLHANRVGGIKSSPTHGAAMRVCYCLCSVAAEFTGQVLYFLYRNTALLAVLFIAHRSEEHTSELQSRFDLVCRLLLEKKKQMYT